MPAALERCVPLEALSSGTHRYSGCLFIYSLILGSSGDVNIEFPFLEIHYI